MLRQGDILLFPLTKEEVSMLKNKSEFEKYIRLPYITANHAVKTLEKISSSVDMENDYWFLNSLWLAVHTKTKEIYGTIRLEKDGEFNKIIKNITLILEYQQSYLSASELFERFLTVNGFNNIVIENDKDLYEG